MGERWKFSLTRLLLVPLAVCLAIGGQTYFDQRAAVVVGVAGILIVLLHPANQILITLGQLIMGWAALVLVVAISEIVLGFGWLSALAPVVAMGVFFGAGHAWRKKLTDRQVTH